MNENIENVLAILDSLRTNDEITYSAYSTLHDEISLLDDLLKEQDKTIESLTKEKERLLLERIAELQHNIDALRATMQDAILVNNVIEQRKAVKWDEP